MDVIKQQDFEFNIVLEKPLIAHLSTVEDGEPRDSPVWYIWEDDCVWIFGNSKDSFVRRLKKDPLCAVGIVDFDLDKGILRHVGIRGTSYLEDINSARLSRFISKYLGNNAEQWNAWFIKSIVDPLDVMVKIVPKSMVAKDVSFFKTGPDLARTYSS